MYSLIGIDDNRLEILNYVLSIMRKEKFTEIEMHNFLTKIQSIESYIEFVDECNVMIDRCNERKSVVE